MADDTMANNEVPATTNQADAMPASEQETVTESVDTVAPGSVGREEAVSQDNDLVLPEGVKERTTQQFDKLREQLSQERVRRMEAEQALKSGSQRSSTSDLDLSKFGLNDLLSPKSNEVKPLYDPTTGIVDVSELENLRTVASQANKRATEAEKRFEKYVQEQQEREAYEAHPELDPKSKGHDPELYNMTRALITDSMMNPKDYGGKELTAKGAADMAKSLRAKELKKTAEEAKQQAVAELTPKEQASLEASGRSDRRLDVQADYDLADRTRRGDKEAIVERLRRIRSV